MKATMVKDVSKYYSGTAILWRLSEPARFWYSDGDETSDFVVTSAVAIPNFREETYVFPCDEDGRNAYMVEQPGSLNYELNHMKAILAFCAHHNEDMT